MSITTEVKDAIRAIAGEQADDVLSHLEAGGKGAVMVSVLGSLAEPESPSDVLAQDWLSLSDLSDEDRKSVLTHLIIDITLGRSQALNDMLVSKKLLNKVKG